MNHPTKKELSWIPGCGEDEVQTVLALIAGELDPETIEGTAEWVRQCYHRPSEDELILDAIDRTIGTYGTEALPLPEEKDNYRNAPRYTYCNAGAPYAATVIHDSHQGVYFVGCWEDIVEARDQGIKP